MFVPSLSWYNDAFGYKRGAKTADVRTHVTARVADKLVSIVVQGAIRAVGRYRHNLHVLDDVRRRCRNVLSLNFPTYVCPKPILIS